MWQLKSNSESERKRRALGLLAGLVSVVGHQLGRERPDLEMANKNFKIN